MSNNLRSPLPIGLAELRRSEKQGRRTDLRIRRTRSLLGNALIALMQEKSIDKITVQEVLDRATVSRSTFYLHYRDKDDLFLCVLGFLHKFRATYATNQLRAGTDIRALQVWMGHKDLASTMRYLKAGYGKDLLAKVNEAFALVTRFGGRSPQEGSTYAGAASVQPPSDQSAGNCPL